MSKQTSISRRRFLGALGVGAAAPHIITSAALGAPGKAPASDQVRVGFIGLGGHGIGRNLRMFLPQIDCRVAALCDCESKNLARGQQTAEQYLKSKGRVGELSGALITKDWRKVIESDVDAVMISTPDHWHCLMSVHALRAGKDVICEKPTYNIEEGRILADTVRRYGAVFQTSTEDRSVAIYHKMAETVRNGRIGKLTRMIVTVPQAPGGPGDPTPKPVPAGLDWDMWLGPAPWGPYCPGRVHFNFRYVADTGTGILADWGMHMVDTAQWANDTERTGPIEVDGAGVRHTTGLYDTFYKFGLKYRYANGVVLEIRSGGTGIRCEGADGWVESKSWRAPLQASRPSILDPIGADGVKLFTCPAGEHRNFLDCVKTRSDPYFPAEVGHRCATIMHMGTIAMTVGRKLTWDPEKEEFPGDTQANRLRGRAMREPWTM